MLGLTEAGPLIVDRLTTLCPAAERGVFATDDLAGVAEKDQVCPALHVVLYDYEPVDAVAGDVQWQEIWLVVAVVKNVAKDRSTAKRAAAAPMLRQALAALSGWRPETGGPALKVVRPPRPSFSSTHAYFPLAFGFSVGTSGAGINQEG